jgi:hypothetical protein
MAAPARLPVLVPAMMLGLIPKSISAFATPNIGKGAAQSRRYHFSHKYRSKPASKIGVVARSAAIVSPVVNLRPELYFLIMNSHSRIALYFALSFCGNPNLIIRRYDDFLCKLHLVLKSDRWQKRMDFNRDEDAP